jgi:hypothetical protein
MCGRINGFIERELKMDQIENKLPNKIMAPEKQLEICNAINAAIAAGKIVTVEYPSVAHSTQIAGAAPNCSGVILVAHLDWNYRDFLPMTWFHDNYTVLARFPAKIDADVIYKPDSPS